MRFTSFSAGALRCIRIAVAIVVPITFIGCGSSAFSNPAASKAPTASMLAQTPSVPPILLFNGTGTLSADVSAVGNNPQKSQVELRHGELKRDGFHD